MQTYSLWAKRISRSLAILDIIHFIRKLDLKDKMHQMSAVKSVREKIML